MGSGGEGVDVGRVRALIFSCKNIVIGVSSTSIMGTVRDLNIATFGQLVRIHGVGELVRRCVGNLITRTRALGGVLDLYHGKAAARSVRGILRRLYNGLPIRELRTLIGLQGQCGICLLDGVGSAL